MVSAANSAARKQRAGETARDAGDGPPENGSAGSARPRHAGPDDRSAGKKSANGKQSAGKGTTAVEPAEASGAQEMETWVQDTAESELAMEGLDHPADLDAVDIAVVDVEVDVNVEIVEIDEALDEADLADDDVVDPAADVSRRSRR